jgi:penicillin-binding protein 1C
VKRWALLPGLMLAAIAHAATPSPEEVRAAHPASAAQLFDRHGVLLGTARTDAHARRGEWVSLSVMSGPLLETVVAVEDHRFPDHTGVDWWAMGAAVVDGLRGHPRGASTIDMQLAALLDARLKPAGPRNLQTKGRQIAAASALNRAWTKDQILEAYLNLLSFRGELVGIAAASRHLLNKAPAAIDRSDALLLAVLIGKPGASLTQVLARGCRLGPTLPTPVSCESFTASATRSLTRQQPASPSALAPQVAAQLLTAKGARVDSTLDAQLQALTLQALQQQLQALEPRNVRDGAALVVDNATGEVLAYVGNGDRFSSARHVDGVRARRQAGSTLKPFLYELALESTRLHAASILDDSPLSIMTDGGPYVPQNYDQAFRGPVSLRTALSGSLNIPAIRTLMLLTPERFLGRLREVGFQGLKHDGDYYGEALALGSPEVTLWELVNAYRTLARGGNFSPLRLLPVAAQTSSAVMSPAASFIIGDILADRGSRSATFGLESPLALPFWAAVKTGTSKQMRDNWCVGYSIRYTVGVWVGNFDGSPMWEVSGLSGAAPVWSAVMQALHETESSDPPPRPAGLEQREVHFEHNLEPTRQEWFLAGTASDAVTPVPVAQTQPRIVAPTNGGILVLDPDIPPAHQRLFFTMAPQRAAVRWRLDEQDLTEAASALPAPGRHRLRLLDAKGVVLDEIRFTVRGHVPVKP